jgi:hypothetical protein
MQRLFQALIAIITLSGCADPLWHREGGCLNPWGGDFLGLKSAWMQVKIKRIEEDWGVSSQKKIWIYAPLLLAMMLIASCSTVSVTRTPSGALHAGVTSFAGKQTVSDATITTREGDTIRINGYSTQNPDPETTKIIRDGVLINTGINAAQSLAQPVANGVGDFIPSNP